MSAHDFIPQMRPLFGEEEKAELADYLTEDGFFTEFKRTELFEQQIAHYTGARHCIVVNNGTVSLTLAAIALGVGPGDEVIVPNYTMIATPNSVKMLGATPVFVDVEPETLVMDLEQARAAITAKTKALMLVSANGRAPKAGIAAFTITAAAELHEAMKAVLMALVALHVLAALWHQFWLKDGLMARMKRPLD